MRCDNQDDYHRIHTTENDNLDVKPYFELPGAPRVHVFQTGKVSLPALETLRSKKKWQTLRTLYYLCGAL